MHYHNLWVTLVTVLACTHNLGFEKISDDAHLYLFINDKPHIFASTQRLGLLPTVACKGGSNVYPHLWFVGTCFELCFE